MHRSISSSYMGHASSIHRYGLSLVFCLQAVFADHLDRGVEFVQTEAWAAARDEFLAGAKEDPSDKRFPLALAKLEYQQGHRADARRYLRQVLRLDPANSEANDLLGQLYYLDGNYDAALLYWNRIQKPRIEGVEVIPPAPISRALIDRALPITTGEVLTRDQYLSSLAWTNNLQVFETPQLELSESADNNYDLELRWRKVPAWMRLASAFGGVPFETFKLSWPNLGGQAATFTALERWDAQKRRSYLSMNGPVGGSAQTRYTYYADGRSETWNLRAPTDFRLQKVESGLLFHGLPSDRFAWTIGIVGADRSFPGSGFTPGITVKNVGALDFRLFDMPARRMTMDLHTSLETGLFFAKNQRLYERAQTYLLWRWLPRVSTKDHEALARIGYGTIIGHPPFDELYMMTTDTDYDLPLRGHREARDGKRGRAPIGGEYLLANLDFYKKLLPLGPVTIDVGPVFDIGTIWREYLPRENGKLLVDAGAQVRFRLPGGFRAVFSYAFDLRTGTGNFNSFTPDVRTNPAGFLP
jgi:hypothetical protein